MFKTTYFIVFPMIQVTHLPLGVVLGKVEVIGVP